MKTSELVSQLDFLVKELEDGPVFVRVEDPDTGKLLTMPLYKIRMEFNRDTSTCEVVLGGKA